MCLSFAKGEYIDWSMLVAYKCFDRGERKISLASKATEERDEEIKSRSIHIDEELELTLLIWFVVNMKALQISEKKGKKRTWFAFSHPMSRIVWNLKRLSFLFVCSLFGIQFEVDYFWILRNSELTSRLVENCNTKTIINYKKLLLDLLVANSNINAQNSTPMYDRTTRAFK